HLRAEVRGLEVNGDALRRDQLDEAIGDLFAQTLLHGEPTREQAHEARQLRDADDLLARDVADVREAVERERVVLAQALERDRPLDDLARRRAMAVALRRERREQLRLALVSGGRVE